MEDPEVQAQKLIVDAEIKAKTIIETAEMNAKSIISVAKEKSEDKLYMDLSRIPLICQSIITIGKDINDIKELIKEEHGDHEARIRALEKNENKSTGVFDGIGISWNVVIVVVGTIISIFAIFYGVKHL